MDAELQAFSLWALIHGVVSLWIQGQLPGHLMQCVSLWEMVIAMLWQVVRVPIEQNSLN